MKPLFPERIRSAILPALLMAVAGGLGCFTMVFPDSSPKWLRTLFGRGLHGPTTSADKVSAKPELSSESMGGDYSALDPNALPKGLTSIDGEGGTGLNRAVKKNGVWYPVYSPGSKTTAGTPLLTVIPLSIASGDPPPGKVNESFAYQPEAIGGTPPYSWSAAYAAPPGIFTFEKSSGLIAGTPLQPLVVPLELSVRDANGTTDSAKLLITILPERALMIETTQLPSARLDESFQHLMQAKGGVPAYRWSIKETLPEGLIFDVINGGLSGHCAQAGQFPLQVSVTDQQGTKAHQKLILKCLGTLDITTESALPPASPGQPYQGQFTATGGTEPYQWSLVEGGLPDYSWKLSPDGTLSGPGSSMEGLAEFTVMVTDAEDLTFEKTFRLSVSDLLILVPSQEKVGVAWPPAAVTGLLASTGTSARGFRVLRNGTPVYEGTGSNFVDRGLGTGTSPQYTLIALTSDGAAQPMASKATTLLPMSLARAQPGRSGDPYADAVTRFSPLTAGGYGSSQVPRNVTGPPDGRSVYAPAYKPGEVLSLHARQGEGGLIELEFTDNIVELASGEDVTIFENVLFIGGNGNQRFMEPAVISVALFPGEWIALPCDVIPPAGDQPLDLRDPYYYSRGIAGRNGTTGEDPTNPARSGGDSFDLDEIASRAGLTWIRFIRISSTGNQGFIDNVGMDPVLHPNDAAFSPLSGTGSSGFDLDAVSAVHY